MTLQIFELNRLYKLQLILMSVGILCRYCQIYVNVNSANWFYRINVIKTNMSSSVCIIANTCKRYNLIIYVRAFHRKFVNLISNI